MTAGDDSLPTGVHRILTRSSELDIYLYATEARSWINWRCEFYVMLQKDFSKVLQQIRDWKYREMGGHFGKTQIKPIKTWHPTDMCVSMTTFVCVPFHSWQDNTDGKDCLPTCCAYSHRHTPVSQVTTAIRCPPFPCKCHFTFSHCFPWKKNNKKTYRPSVHPLISFILSSHSHHIKGGNDNNRSNIPSLTCKKDRMDKG